MPVKRRKPIGERKGEVIRVRVTVTQKDALTLAAHGAGLELSSWLRAVGLREAGWTSAPETKGKGARKLR